jgi:hypothetical protein
MVDLRWVTPPGTTTKAPTLQWRSRKADPWGRLTLWDDWQDVPTAVVAPKPADCNRGNKCPWDDGDPSYCRHCGLRAQGSGQ